MVPSTAIPTRTKTTPAFKPMANIGVPYSELHPMECQQNLFTHEVKAFAYANLAQSMLTKNNTSI